jgi:hypothetical protein
MPRSPDGPRSAQLAPSQSDRACTPRAPALARLLLERFRGQVLLARFEEEGTIRTRTALHPAFGASMGLRLLAVVVLSSACAGIARAQAVDDPRSRARLAWDAPEPGTLSGPAVGYELRTATTPPSADLDAWWAAASPRPGVPAPTDPGTPQNVQLTGLTPGATVYAALRAVDGSGLLSRPILVTSWTPPGDPILQGISPTRVTAAGPQDFLIRGVGLDGVTAVTFRSVSGGRVAASVVGLEADGSLRVSADPAGLGDGAVTVDADAGGTVDHLYGWIEVALETTADTEPPAAVGDLAASVTGAGSVRLAWTAPADPTPEGTGAAVHYEVRRIAAGPEAFAWESGVTVATGDPGAAGSPVANAVSGLAAGSTQTFAVRTGDAAGNLSAVSNLATVVLPAPDTLPPAPVTDLGASVLGPGSVRLTWTAPADSTPTGAGTVAVYDLRRLGGEPGSWSFASGVPLGTDPPGAPGTPQSVTVTDLPPGSAQAFALTSLDRAGNTSALSNVVEVLLPEPPDTTAPAAVTDLGAALQADGQALLTWTAPADDRGSAAAYLVYRWDGDPGSPSLDAATLLSAPPAPAAPGSPESWLAGEVAAGTAATFALCSVDAAGNVSPLSGPATLDRTGEDVTPPAAPGEFAASPFSASSIQLRWLAPGGDGMAGRADHYELRRAMNPDPASSWWEGATGEVLKGTPKWPGKQEFVNLSGLDRAVTQAFALRAVDEAGLASPWVIATVAASVTGGRHPAAAPPPPPDTLSASVEVGGVRLVWNAVAAPEVECYRVYRSAEGGKPALVATVDVTRSSWLDAAAGPGVLRYAVSTMDADENESRLGAWVEVVMAPGARVAPDGAGWRLSLPDRAEASNPAPPRMTVYDVQGRLVAALEPGRSGGAWEARWDGRSRNGVRVAGGIFFVRIVEGNRVAVRKLLVRR